MELMEFHRADCNAVKPMKVAVEVDGRRDSRDRGTMRLWARIIADLSHNWANPA